MIPSPGGGGRVSKGYDTPSCLIATSRQVDSRLRGNDGQASTIRWRPDGPGLKDDMRRGKGRDLLTVEG